jgi:hypothetical protein
MRVICPQCLVEAVITVDVTDGDSLKCSECDSEYSADDVKNMIESWATILPWLLSHPARTPECATV